jgi:hypothetical protein
MRLFITENQITSPKVHGSAVCNPNYRRPVLRILVEREIMTPRINKKKRREERREKECRICAPKQSLQFPKVFRTRFGGWLFVYP